MAVYMREEQPTKDIKFRCEVYTVEGHTGVDHGSSSGVIMEGTGEHSGLEIAVEAEGTKVKTLHFMGCWPIYAGDILLVYMKQYVKREDPALKAVMNTPEMKKTLKKMHKELGTPSKPEKPVDPLKKLPEHIRPYKIQKLAGSKVLATYTNQVNDRDILHY